MEKKSKNIQNRNKEISLIGLFGIETFETLQKRLSDATDFSFSTIDYRGGKVVKSYYPEAYADLLMEDGDGSSCQMSCAFAAAKAAITNLPYIYLCQCGLVKVAIPIVVNDQYLGAIICGYVRCDDMDAVDPISGIQIVQKDFSVDVIRNSMEKWEKLPSFSAGKIKDIANMVFFLVQEMCQKENYALHLGDEEHNKVHLSDMRRKNKELRSTVADLKKEVMKANIYPQTLLNMLVTISSVAILEEASMTQEMILSLSSILRYYIEYRRDYISLENELEQIKHYMSILRLRYENRLNVEVNYPDSVKEQMIPKLILLPLLEYVVNFGIMNQSFKGSLLCDVEMISERCVITICLKHDTEGMVSMGFLKESGNVMDERMFHEQLKQLETKLSYEYGDNYKLSVEEENVLLDIPRKNQ